MRKPNGLPFIEFPKIARLSREIIVTEKIDGTNAQIYIPDVGEPEYGEVFAGSRTKWIDPQDDNMGFAKWVDAHREELKSLGPGNHFGEWWGKGIQRGYNVPDKRFSLFNVSRWGPGGKDEAMKPACCLVVPTLYRGAFDMQAIDECINRLRIEGSVAAPKFMRPEGVVVFHTAGSHLYKKTLEKDHLPKGLTKE